MNNVRKDGYPNTNTYIGLGWETEFQVRIMWTDDWTAYTHWGFIFNLRWGSSDRLVSEYWLDELG
jgi:hypothetical protein